MKYIIKNILKEDYVNKKKTQEYLDFIVDEMLNGVKIKKDYPPNPTFNTITEFVDLYGNEELKEAMTNPENFNRLGWEEREDDDGWSYFRTDNPKDKYGSDEFAYEFGYDWLQHLVDDGELRILTINSGEWEVVHQDLVMGLIVNGAIIRQTPLHRVFSKHKYTNPIPRLNKEYVHNRIMEQIIEIYKISKEEFGLVFTKFKSKLTNLIKDKWGVEVVEKEDALSNSYVNESIVDDFIEFGKEELSLGDGFNVKLTDDNDELETLASYDMSDNEITVLQKNRAVPDIIRSIAHEMVHHKQNELGDLKGNPEEGEDGSPWEDQANSKAGELVRMFGKEFPEIYDL
jgi:hypothetical protein